MGKIVFKNIVLKICFVTVVTLTTVTLVWLILYLFNNNLNLLTPINGFTFYKRVTKPTNLLTELLVQSFILLFSALYLATKNYFIEKDVLNIKYIVFNIVIIVFTLVCIGMFYKNVINLGYLIK